MSDNGFAPTPVFGTEAPPELMSIVEALTAAKTAMVEGGLTPERLVELVQGATRKKRGRKVPELPQFTFPDSAYTVRVRYIGPWTLDQIRVNLQRIRREPQVPVIEVEDGEDGHGRPRYRKEANAADPAYKQAVKDYEEWVSQAMGQRLLDVVAGSAVVVDPDDMDPDEIDLHRRALLRAGPHEGEDGYEAHVKLIENMPDEEVFVRCVAIRSGRDLVALQKFVMSRSTPSSEGVAEQISAFPAEVQGP